MLKKLRYYLNMVTFVAIPVLFIGFYNTYHFKGLDGIIIGCFAFDSLLMRIKDHKELKSELEEENDRDN